MNYTIFYGVNYMYGYEYGSTGKTRHITRKCKQLLCNYYLYDEFVLSKLQLQGICIFLRYFIIRILRNKWYYSIENYNLDLYGNIFLYRNPINPMNMTVKGFEISTYLQNDLHNSPCQCAL